jgi:hypothetical protein
MLRPETERNDKGLKKLHDEELDNFYTSPDVRIIK